MHDAVPVTLPLQNHFPVVMHFTTDAGEWIPQYLHDTALDFRPSLAKSGSQQGHCLCCFQVGTSALALLFTSLINPTSVPRQQ